MELYKCVRKTCKKQVETEGDMCPWCKAEHSRLMTENFKQTQRRFGSALRNLKDR